ncbi:MAG: DoxX family protein [Bacteroidota bacterium]
MNTALWICQGILTIAFLYSGVTKSTQSERKLVEMGQTGVEGLPQGVIRFAGISELFGVMGLWLPWLSGIMPVLTPVAALCLGAIMIPAAVIHTKRKETPAVMVNIFLFMLCAFVAYGRFRGM